MMSDNRLNVMLRRKMALRHRGGQPGNQNARKNGYYAAILSPSEQAELSDLLAEGVEHVIAFSRIRIKSILGKDPIDSCALSRVLKSLVNWYVLKNNLSSSERAALRKYMRHLFTQNSP